MPRETEAKFKINSTNKLKNILKKIGARPVYKRLEKDTYYQDPSTRFHSVVMRIRLIGKKEVFTIKAEVPRQNSHVYKMRNEFEINIDDVKTFRGILESLGFWLLSRKEKLRKMYEYKGARISVDKLPFIGSYVEIEASKDKIREIARLLGFSIKNAMPDTYTEIFNRYKIRQKKRNLKLVFKKRERK